LSARPDRATSLSDFDKQNMHRFAGGAKPFQQGSIQIGQGMADIHDHDQTASWLRSDR
jgi:hypothetical protein